MRYYKLTLPDGTVRVMRSETLGFYIKSCGAGAITVPTAAEIKAFFPTDTVAEEEPKQKKTTKQHI